MSQSRPESPLSGTSSVLDRMKFTPISPDEYSEASSISEMSSNDSPSIINHTTQATTGQNFIPTEKVIINQETELLPIGTSKLGFLNKCSHNCDIVYVT